MFDIGFWEIIIIAVVALVVVGPERFPGMIKKIGYWVGQFRRIAATVKSEIKDEVDKADQLQKLIDEQKALLEKTASADLTKPAVTPLSEREKVKPPETQSSASAPVDSGKAATETGGASSNQAETNQNNK